MAAASRLDELLEEQAASGHPQLTEESQKLAVQAMHQAAMMGKVDAVQQALRNGLDVDVRGNGQSTAYMLACLNDRVEVCEMLLEAGCDTSLVDAQGRTGLDKAVSRGRHNVQSLLAKHAAAGHAALAQDPTKF